jgi:gamma-glutamyltranspeptidase / glutathione hydrolase / leukotriene-C4 hydrolase
MKFPESLASWSGIRHSTIILPTHTEKRTFTTEAWRSRRRLWEITLVLFILVLTVASGGIRQFIVRVVLTGAKGGKSGDKNPAYLIKAEHGAVASENELCSRIGVEILKDGGNAIDSAVGTVFCIGVVNMFS